MSAPLRSRDASRIASPEDKGHVTLPVLDPDSLPVTCSLHDVSLWLWRFLEHPNEPSITRTDLTAEDLRRAARAGENVIKARRCLAIASVLEVRGRGDAAEAAGMQRQTLRDWVHRYNAEDWPACWTARSRRAPIF